MLTDGVSGNSARRLPYFRFWCYKVIPLVYDNSLSYYEVLCKVVKYINELIESDKEIVKEIDKLPKKVKISLEKGKNVDNEWNKDKNKTNLLYFLSAQFKQ